MSHRFGYIPDLPDHRDWLFSARRSEALALSLPLSVSLHDKCSPVEDQGQLGSCTANALVGALEYLELKDGKPLADLSRLFVYYNERALEGTVASDSGAMIRDGIKSLAKQGVCSEKAWPYRINRFTAKPSAKCYAEALTHKVTSYARIQTLADMRACLAGGFPFVFGFSVYESMETPEVDRSGNVPLPVHGEQLLGGHAVLAVGYDDVRRVINFRNSWGSGWGDGGYGTIPYAYITNRSLAGDMWAMTTAGGL